ncbi:MAG: hypothetical protein HYS45_00365 [Parcubacteria group bacterium]|nr:hypothetical protein [Parcubacteria group bacterium]
MARIRLAWALARRSPVTNDYVTCERGFLDADGVALSDEFMLKQASQHGLDLSALIWHAPQEDELAGVSPQIAAVEAASA